MYWLTAVFYPDQYQQELAANVREFYDKFYRVKLTDKQVDALVRPAVGASGATGSQIGVPLLGAEPVPFPGTAPGGPAIGGKPRGRGGLGAPALPNPQ